jgi:predicted acylesterase/phospholipase RssA
MAGIGVALSGGGHRAALFGLGPLLYLADAGKNGDVTSIASVSGGSLTNGFVAQELNYRTASPEEFEAVATRFATQLTQRGTLWVGWVTKAFVAVLGLTFLASFLVWLLPWHWSLRLLAWIAALLVWAKIAEQRGRVCALTFRQTLFSPSGKRATLLREVHPQGDEPPIDHVVCATDLHAGEHVYFSGKFVCAYRFGWGQPADLPLHVAVQCSSSLPGAFPVRWLPTAPHGFVEGSDGDRSMALTDGGVYDNMADQWGQAVGSRKKRWAQHAAGLQEPEELIVVNSSGGMEFSPVSSLHFPLLGEIRALLRDKTILYDNTTSLRRYGLVGRFDRAQLEGRGLRGALVHIPESPFTAAVAVKDSTDPNWGARAQRAKEVIAKLEEAGERADAWEREAAASRSTKTTLSKMGTDKAARLVRHSYLLAMANLHVFLGYPLLDVPALSRFVALVGGA